MVGRLHRPLESKIQGNIRSLWELTERPFSDPRPPLPVTTARVRRATGASPGAGLHEGPLVLEVVIGRPYERKRACPGRIENSGHRLRLPTDPLHRRLIKRSLEAADVRVDDLTHVVVVLRLCRCLYAGTNVPPPGDCSEHVGSTGSRPPGPTAGPRFGSSQPAAPTIPTVPPVRSTMVVSPHDTAWWLPKKGAPVT